MRLRLAFTLALLLALTLPGISWADDGSGARGGKWIDPPAYNHGMWAGQAECGERVFKADLTKGRTDSLVFHARHTAGCFTYDYTNYVPAGPGESQGNSWQMAECRRYAEYDMAVVYFDMWAHVKVDPADIQYTCTPYHGPD